MAPTDNVDTLKWAYGLWSESKGESIEAWAAIAHDDFRVISAADEYAAAAFGAAPAGKAGLRQYLRAMTTHWEMQTHEVRRYIADGDSVAAVIDAIWKNRETGRLSASVIVNVWTFREGKATEVMEVFDTASMVAATQPAGAYSG